MKALLIIDMQNDFMPGGALPVKDADTLAPLINQLMNNFPLIVASQDSHPPDHISFAINHPGKQVGDSILVNDQIQHLWPVHCVKETPGCALIETLDHHKITKVFPKGESPELDSYSAFFDNAHLKSTGLDTYLKEKKVTELYIGGVATDYCVLYSALDALRLGFKVTIIQDACKGVDVNPYDSQRALDQICSRGGDLRLSHQLAKV